MAISQSVGWMIGVLLSVFASWVGAASKLVIRKSWKIIEGVKEEDDNYLTLFARSRFLHSLGLFGMTVLNPACGIGAMKFANPSLLAPFSGLTLVWVVLFSKSTTGEEPTLVQIIAASTIVLGEIIVTLFGDHSNEDELSLDRFNDIYRSSKMIAYFTGFGVFYTLVTLGCKSNHPMIEKLSWGLSGGSIAGLLMFIKDSLSLFKTESPWHWQIWLFLSGAMFVGLYGIRCLSYCMKRYDTTYSATMFVVSYIFSADIMSLIRYDIYKNMDTVSQKVMFPVGMIILLGGVIVLMTEKIPGFCWRTVGACRREDAKPLLDGDNSAIVGVGDENRSLSSADDKL
ncbi:hypothetical protein TL16_g11751 [Triparma laevis f. inornata]|uniref:Magnesium transporter n=1 Tax=Triparma laevis f. inornata TaxID=1714386 RepID=A0A9W7BFY4_9STRA|nr:hypothetical protein TL16_g11751 [Triparma laevis f. inornata]